MNMKFVACVGGLVATALFLNSGCDWSSQGSSLNTSQGAGINVNFSGVYNGTLAGGKAVAKTSGGNIIRLVIHHAGNSIEVTDNQGSHYSGSVGAPGTVSSAGSDGTYPAGAELVQSQINFKGKDEVAQKDIEFVGVIHAVAVQDVRGNTSESSTSTTDNNVVKTTSTKDDGVNTTITEIDTIGVIGDPFYQQTTITTVIKDETGEELSRTVTTEGSNKSTSSTTYNVTESATQFRLEGTWIEKDSPIVSDVDALSPGNAFTITTTATTTDTTTTQ